MSEETFRVVVSAGVVLAALSVIVQAIVVIGIAAGLRKTQVRVAAVIDRAEPIMDTARRLIDDSVPKITSITTDAADVVKMARDHTERLGDVVKDFSQRAKVQVARIDETMDQTLDQVQVAGDAVKNAVLRPVREMSGVLAGVKTALSVYTQGRRASVDHATQDEEMFI